MNKTLNQLSGSQEFIQRHVGPDADETQKMLDYLGVSSLDELIEQTVPNKIRREEMNLPSSRSEQQALEDIGVYASENKVYRSFIGMGYYHTKTPTVILRNVLENPGWYTAYTPYQPEIAQGRLEAILTYQQMTMDLTGLDLASASLLDEATAAAEAMAMAKRVSKNKKSNQFFVDEDAFPQTIDVIKTRAAHYGFELIFGKAKDAANHDVFGAFVQYTNRYGEVIDLQEVISQLQANKAIVAVAADIMSLVMLKAPGEMGADIVLGSSQRFGVPMGFGGPHAAFFATSEKHKRAMPGRIIGVSIDSNERQAYRMAMQTREQHIRREKATSNICTAQVLLANIAAFYAVYHGPQGLKDIAHRIHRLTGILAHALQEKGLQLVNKSYFDTLTIDAGDQRDEIIARAAEAKINLRVDDNGQIGLSLDEVTTEQEVQKLYSVISGDDSGLDLVSLDEKARAHESFEKGLLREKDILTHATFNTHHSETEMLRYLKHLENKDLSLAHAMIPLGSCTMKLNSTSEMLPVTWKEFGHIHPFAPASQTMGYQKMIEELESWLAEITGYDAVTVQPNSGAQGEYAGLLAIRGYHESIGEGHRNICLIPSSAHGTNPASAQMANMKVVIVNCDDKGNIDFEDLKAKAEEVSENLSCLMVTYPSTHGVFEETIKDICSLIHEHGGQVYMDGANMNAQVGITSPGLMGSDVSHLNLHKTFAIPHGGGGPGVGPIGVKSHLKPFLPNHAVRKLQGTGENNGAVSAAPYGSAGVLPISWMYCAMLGKEGLTHSTKMALLNANYLTKRLSEYYPILFTGRNDKVAHECIVDLRPLKAETGITEVDIAKRLMDYGFHAPTMSFPVAGTLMIEPTESEPFCEIERFAEAMISIKKEIEKVASGEWEKGNNPLTNAPHTQFDLLNWNKPYSIQEGAYPVQGQQDNKFWPTVNRIDDVYGDRNLLCSCPSPEDYR
ncbi:aminomethyl-transferring glycine dehydrogenase [Aliikangiella sp. G2MR2-5]|uniref:aminomethyl-transferring glycine dehydrogenase n=1 Tax=Aliikangiella sp. G2MR2-5 TaxID=2788943 RepID=UPI0018A97CA6|nr:aminomethyl-transferring glycine dehydrogenase [Aliikangiella sp. G2MR2-5]